MKKLSIIMFFLFIATVLHAQDTIYRVDGSKQEVIIVEVNPSQIRYIRANDPDSTVHVIAKQAVARIIYTNGTVISIQAPVVAPNADAAKVEEPVFHRNILSFNTLELINAAVALSYERTWEARKFGIKIPFSFGLGRIWDDNDYENFYRGPLLFSTGLAFNYYPLGQENITAFIGMSVVYGKHNYIVDERDYLMPANVEFGIEKTARFYGGALNVGARARINNNFGVTALLGLGIGKAERYEGTIYGSGIDFLWPAELGLVFRF